MKVYLVLWTEAQYDPDWQICGIFSTKDKGQNYINEKTIRKRYEYDVIEYEIDNPEYKEEVK